MIHTSHPRFDFRDLRTGRPLVPLSGVMFLLDRDEDDVLNLINLRLLAFAFDLRSPTADRRDVYVWRESLTEYKEQAPGVTLGLREPNGAALARVVETIVPAKRTLRVAELARLFTCSAQHVHNLLEAREFAQAKAGNTVNLSPTVTRASVVEFLKARRIA